MPQKSREDLLKEFVAQEQNAPQDSGTSEGIVSDNVRNLLVAGSLAGLIPTGATQVIGGLSGLGLAGISGIEAIKALQKGNYKEAGLEGLMTLLGAGGAGGAFRALRGATTAAKVGATAPAAAVTKRIRSAPGLPRVVPEGSGIPAELRAAIEARQPVLANPMEAAEANTQQLARKLAMKLQSAPIEVQKVDGAIEALMRKLNFPEDAVDQIRRAIISKGTQPAKLTKKQLKALDELGMSASELMIKISAIGGGAAVGAVRGAQSRPEDAERPPWQYAAAGAGAGAAAGLGLSSLAMAGASGGSKAIAKKLTDFNYFSLLSSPGTIGRAILGNTTSTVAGALVRLGEGEFSDAARILKTLGSETSKGTFIKALMDPGKYIPAAVQQHGRIAVQPGIMGIPTRFIAAADAVASKALMAGGFSREDALRLSLSGDPQTAVGQWLLRAFGLPVTKVSAAGRKTIQKPLTNSELGQLALRFYLPFARVAVALPERMLEYSPITAMSPTLQKTFGHRGIAETVTKALMGPATGLAYGLGANTITPDVDPIAVSMAGPLAGWAGAGLALARGTFRDKPALSAVNEIIQNLPLMAEQISATAPLERLIPSLLRDTARGMDPAFGREKGPSQVLIDRLKRGGEPGFLKDTLATITAPVQARIPVLREALPEETAPTSIFGQQLYPKRQSFPFISDTTLRGFIGGTKIDVPGQKEGVIPKFFTSTPMSNPPVFPPGNPTAQAIRDIQRRSMPMGEIISPPSVTEPKDLGQAMTLAGRQLGEIPRDIRALAARARGAPIEAVLGRMVQSPTFQRMPPDLQNLMLQRAISSVRERIGSPISSAVTGSVVAPQSQDEIREMLRRVILGFEGAR